MQKKKKKVMELTDIATVVLVNHNLWIYSELYKFGLIIITEILHEFEPAYYSDVSSSSKNRAHGAAPSH